MEFEDVEKEVEWEARRVAAAFQVEQWWLIPDSDTHYQGQTGAIWTTWGIDMNMFKVKYIDIWNADDCDTLVLLKPDGSWEIDRLESTTGSLMSRGLYRLGVSDETLYSQLPPLNTHEQLELRLSMPREFWPQMWIEEEDVQ